MSLDIQANVWNPTIRKTGCASYSSSSFPGLWLSSFATVDGAKRRNPLSTFRGFSFFINILSTSQKKKKKNPQTLTKTASALSTKENRPSPLSHHSQFVAPMFWNSFSCRLWVLSSFFLLGILSWTWRAFWVYQL